MFVENSWGLSQRFGINHPSGRAQLKWHHIPKLRVPPSKRLKWTILQEKRPESASNISDVPETYVENSWVLINIMASITQVAALNWSGTIYPNLGYPRQKHRKSIFLQEKWSESASDISDVPET